MSKFPWDKLVKDTVGYSECEHKEAFMLGAHIMHTKLSVEHDLLIDAWQQDGVYWKNRAADAENDLKGLAGIVKRAIERDE